MIERIVVPLDGSQTAEAILPQVHRVLHRNDSEIILVRAVHLVPIEHAMMHEDAALAAAREYILGQRDKLERAGVKVKWVVRMGPPVDVILDVVKEEYATLIALATHGASGVSRLLMGSVADTLLRKSPVPLLVVRPFWSYEWIPPSGDERRSIQNLLLPVDESDLSMGSLPGIVELATLFDMRVVLLRVLEGQHRKPGSFEEHREAQSQLRPLADAIEKKGVEAVTLVEEGDPARKILDAIRIHGIDLIAMTTHGRSGLSRLLTGSVTERVMRSATVPLLVMSSPERHPSKEGVVPTGTSREH